MARILYIEDDEELRGEISHFLIDLGHTVLQVGDGQTGLDMADSSRPDLILCDRMMPGVSGVEVLERLRDNGTPSNGTKFVFLSALSDRRDIGAVVDLMPDAYLTKPIDLAKLKNVIDELVA